MNNNIARSSKLISLFDSLSGSGEEAMNYMKFLMKLGKYGDDEVIVCSIKGKKDQKKNQNMHRHYSGESSHSDMKQGSPEICSGFRPYQ